MPCSVVDAPGCEVFHNLISGEHSGVGRKVVLFKLLVCFLSIIRTLVLPYDGLALRCFDLSFKYGIQKLLFLPEEVVSCCSLGTYWGLRTSLRSCACAILVNVRCHLSMFFSSFKVGKALKSHLILHMNRSLEIEMIKIMGWLLLIVEMV
jgi:hypothetical protein